MNTPTEPQNGTQQATAQPKAPAPIVLTDNEDSSRALNAFASQANFVAGQRIAQALSQSTLIPKEYQGQISNCLIAIEIAARIGASVFMVMQNLDIIHGRPSWRATFLIATVNASRRFTPLRFRFEGKPGTQEWGCRAYAKDRENGDECVGTLITIAMSKAEGWSTKTGTKWATMPEQMLMYRAAAFWTRVYAPELSLGMQTTDEAIDTEGWDTTNGATPAQTEEIRQLEEKLRARPAETPAVKVSADPKPRDFLAEIAAIRLDLGEQYDEACVDGKVPPAKLAEMRAAIDAFCADAPADLVKDARKFWAFLSGEQP